MTIQKYQGDVSLIKIEKAPKNIVFKKLNKDLVVREGEITNHLHLLTKTKEAEISYANFLDEWYLKIEKGSAVITHPEHKEITLDEGLYFIGKQWEYDEIEKRREVQD